MTVILQGSWETGNEGWLQTQMGSPTPLYRLPQNSRTGLWAVSAQYSNIYRRLPDEALNSDITISCWQKAGMTMFGESSLNFYIGYINSWGELDRVADLSHYQVFPLNNLYHQGTAHFTVEKQYPEMYIVMYSNNEDPFLDDWYFEYTPRVTTSTYVKDNNLWKPAEKFVRHNNIWKPADTLVRHANIWKEV